MKDKKLPEGMLTGTGIIGFALAFELLQTMRRRGVINDEDVTTIIAGALQQVASIEHEKPSPALLQASKLLAALLKERARSKPIH